MYWNEHYKKLMAVIKGLPEFYPKGIAPPTMSGKFLESAHKFADDYLQTREGESGYVRFTQRLALAKESQLVNEILLNYAGGIATYQR